MAVVQHLMGLATGVLVYVVLRRWSVSDRVALLASLPVLFDAMELVVEHSVLSDVLFDLLVVGAVAVLAWDRQPGVRHAGLAGLLLGLAVCVRVVVVRVERTFVVVVRCTTPSTVMVFSTVDVEVPQTVSGSRVTVVVHASWW